MIDGVIGVYSRPRTGSSMMCHCLHLAGVPKAFYEGNRPLTDVYRNPNGFYEGGWNGQNGLIKILGSNDFRRYPNPRFILMTRDARKSLESWDEVMTKLPTPPKIPFVPMEMRIASTNKQIERMRENLKGYPHIEVDYDTFVTDPEHYREMFITLFPELDYDLIISGIDKDLYINR